MEIQQENGAVLVVDGESGACGGCYGVLMTMDLWKYGVWRIYGEERVQDFVVGGWSEVGLEIWLDSRETVHDFRGPRRHRVVYNL